MPYRMVCVWFVHGMQHGVSMGRTVAWHKLIVVHSVRMEFGTGCRMI